MKNSIPKRLHAPLVGLLACALLLLGGCKDRLQPAKPKPAKVAEHLAVVADSAMVVSAHPLASQIGIDVMKQGGNAADAAVAVHFALAVCFPYAGNIGGGGFALVREANGEANALDFREMAPMAAHRDLFLDAQGDVIPLSEKGHRAAGVPGAVDGMVALHTRYGHLPWAQLIQPSIDLARKGFAATANEAKWLNDQDEDFRCYNPCHDAYLLSDQGWLAGDAIVQEDLAQTLERIRDAGRAGFYRGKSAELLLSEMQCGGGIITQDDLDGYQSIWREPLRGTYKGHSILTMPPPSSGGIVLLQLLAMVAAHPLATWGPDDARTIHLMVEAERRAFADRAEFMADPDFVQVPVAGLLDSAYIHTRMADFDPAHATPSSKIGHGAPRFEPTETTHFSIIDPAGNAISLTTTLNSPYGSKVWVAGAGYLLNNEMDDFSAKPGVPNIFGLVGNEANAIAPRKRMLSSMTPTIVDKGGKVYLVLGTPGGATITTSVFQVILDVIDHGMSLQEAVDRKRFHHQWLPDEVAIEDSAFTLAAWQALRALGHNVCVREPIGRVDAIRIREDGKLEGAADHRRDDAAAGW
jgi:gamma-glutamyltranspeptidase / glutathione hydrolase